MAKNEALAQRTTRVRTISEHAPSQSPGTTIAGASAYRQGDQIVSWNDSDGWYACLQGTGTGGNWYESDDFGPFRTREQAEQAASDHYDSCHDD